MIALNRWIALAAAAAILPVGLAGCKMGSCHQTSCSAVNIGHTGCAETKVACGLHPQNCVGSTILPPGHAVTPPGHHAPSSKPSDLEPNGIPEESFDAVPGPPGEEEAPAENEAQRYPFALPEPVTQIQTQPGPGSPVLTVSQTRATEGSFQVPSYPYPPRRTDVLESSGMTHNSRAQVQVTHNLSRPWSDALGLPAKEAQSVEPYRGW